MERLGPWYSIVFGSAVAVLHVTALHAQTTAAATAQSSATTASQSQVSNEPTIEEIIVTAQKRGEALKDIPVSISAFSAAQLEQSGIKNLEDLQSLVPGLQIGHDREGDINLSIRGISSNIGLESGIAIHEDGVYLSQRPDQAQAYFDVDRIEVLRGPQGTLYGRNATGGVVNVITKDPTSDLEAGVEGTVGNYGLIAGNGYVSGPLSDDLVARIAYSINDLRGYGTNYYTGQPVNGVDTSSFRAKLLFRPTSSLTIKLTSEFSDTQSNYVEQESRDFSNIPLLTETGGFVLPTGFNADHNSPDVQTARIWGTTLAIDLDTSFATLSSITGYRDLDRDESFDIDGSPENRASIPSYVIDNNQFTQELDIKSLIGGNFNWLLGGFYFHNNNRENREILTSLIPGSPPIFQIDYPYTTEAYAGFGEASYRFLGVAKLTLGGRYSTESSQMTEFAISKGSAEIQSSGTWSSFTPKAALSVDISERTTAYVTWSRGFKSGGFNLLTFNPVSFAPEKVTNYEIGLKGSTPNRVLSGSIDAFYMDYSDLQVPAVILENGIPNTVIDNAARATIKGIEAEFLLRPNQHFSVDASLTLLDGKYKQFMVLDHTIPSPPGAPLPDAAGYRDAAGNRMENSPPFAANIGVNYETPVRDGWIVKPRVEVVYQSNVYFTPLEDLRGISQSAYALFNANLELAKYTGRPHEPNLTLDLFVRNIGNKLVASEISETNDSIFTGIFKTETYKPPRTFGITVGVKY